MQANQDQQHPEMLQTVFSEDLLHNPPVFGTGGYPDTSTQMLSTTMVPPQPQQLNFWNNVNMDNYHLQQISSVNYAQLPSTSMLPLAPLLLMKLTGQAFNSHDIATTYPPRPVLTNTNSEASYSVGMEDDQVVGATNPATGWSA